MSGTFIRKYSPGPLTDDEPSSYRCVFRPCVVFKVQVITKWYRVANGLLFVETLEIEQLFFYRAEPLDIRAVRWLSVSFPHVIRTNLFDLSTFYKDATIPRRESIFLPGLGTHGILPVYTRCLSGRTIQRKHRQKVDGLLLQGLSQAWDYPGGP